MKSKSSNYHLLPIIIVLSILPLIVRAKILEYDTSELHWYAQDLFTHTDIFTYYKSLILVLVAIIMVVIIIYYSNSDHSMVNKKYYYPAYFYAIIVLISTILSTNIYYSLKGYINHLENVFVLLSYIVIFLYTASFVKNENDLKTLNFAWVTSIGLLTLIGLTQYLGFDIYRSEFGLSMILPPQLHSQIASVDFTLWKDNLIYQSLFHYNYVSYYSALAFPFFLALAISHKQLKMKVFYAITLAVIVFNLLGSQGRNGFIGLVIGSFIVILLNLKKLLKSKATYIILIAVTLILTIVVFNTETVLEGRLKLAISELNQTTDYPLNTIETTDNSVTIDHNTFILTLEASNNNNGKTTFSFYDENKSDIKLMMNENKIILDHNSDSTNSYSVLDIQLLTYNGNDVIELSINQNKWHFMLVDKKMMYLTPYGTTVDLDSTASIGFAGKERWGSMRGYIWSRSIPLVLEKPLFGSGPDTFPLSFPQEDYVGKWNAYRSMTTLVDKPHNIYLGYAINTGILSLLMFLALA